MVRALCESGWDAREAAGEASGDGKEGRRVRNPQTERKKPKAARKRWFFSFSVVKKLANAMCAL
jgi:hypothetical protein